MATEDGRLKILDLRIFRRQLAAMNLDWDMPPLRPEQAIKGPNRLTLTVVTGSSPDSGSSTQR
jgi:hypothetical protein